MIYRYLVLNDMNLLTNLDQKIPRTLVLISIIQKCSMV